MLDKLYKFSKRYEKLNSQEQIISHITDKEISNIIEDLYVDDAVDMLDELYKKFGYYYCAQKSFACEGQSGMARIKEITI